MRKACGRTAFLLLLFFTAGPALAADQALATLTIESQDGASHAFRIELAVTPQQQARGLMFRAYMAADAGMLFDFREEREIAMWMKNTQISLDMLFIRKDGRIATIAERTEPYSLRTIRSRVPVRAVLEVNGGTVSRLDIRPGDRVVHPIFAPKRPK